MRNKTQKGDAMKKLNIYYHLVKGEEIAETCITLPLQKSIADDVIKNQSKSRHLENHEAFSGDLCELLQYLALLQGYNTARFVLAEIPHEEPGVHFGY
jgi:hypothetical protein